MKGRLYPVVHEQILHNEVGDERFERCGELLWGQLSQMTQGGQRGDELLQVGRVQAFVQRLKRHSRAEFSSEQQAGFWVITRLR